MVTNGSGAVVSRKDFTAFGEETVTPQRIASLGYNPQNIRQDYTGYQKDSESGLEFAQARYYNPLHGRFTSVDPLTASATIRNPQTFNRYSYVLNSPYKFSDPLGLIPSSTGACGQWCRNTGPQVDGSAFRGRDATFDWITPEITLPNVTAMSRQADGTPGPITKEDRKALQKNLRKLVPGTRVTKEGRIVIPGVAQNTPGYRLLSGIGSTGVGYLPKQLTIVVNHDGENYVDPPTRAAVFGMAADMVVNWDPDLIVWMEVRAKKDLIISEPRDPVLGLAHELIHAYNYMRPYPNAYSYSFLGNRGNRFTHYFTEGDFVYSESAHWEEFRTLGYFGNHS